LGNQLRYSGSDDKANQNQRLQELVVSILYSYLIFQERPTFPSEKKNFSGLFNHLTYINNDLV